MSGGKLSKKKLSTPLMDTLVHSPYGVLKNKAHGLTPAQSTAATIFRAFVDPRSSIPNQTVMPGKLRKSQNYRSPMTQTSPKLVSSSSPPPSSSTSPTIRRKRLKVTSPLLDNESIVSYADFLVDKVIESRKHHHHGTGVIRTTTSSMVPPSDSPSPVKVVTVDTSSADADSLKKKRVARRKKLPRAELSQAEGRKSDSVAAGVEISDFIGSPLTNPSPIKKKSTKLTSSSLSTSSPLRSRRPEKSQSEHSTDNQSKASSSYANLTSDMSSDNMNEDFYNNNNPSSSSSLKHNHEYPVLKDNNSNNCQQDENEGVMTHVQPCLSGWSQSQSHGHLSNPQQPLVVIPSTISEESRPHQDIMINNNTNKEKVLKESKVSITDRESSSSCRTIAKTSKAKLKKSRSKIPKESKDTISIISLTVSNNEQDMDGIQIQNPRKLVDTNNIISDDVNVKNIDASLAPPFLIDLMITKHDKQTDTFLLQKFQPSSSDLLKQSQVEKNDSKCLQSVSIQTLLTVGHQVGVQTDNFLLFDIKDLMSCSPTASRPVGQHQTKMKTKVKTVKTKSNSPKTVAASASPEVAEDDPIISIIVSSADHQQSEHNVVDSPFFYLSEQVSSVGCSVTVSASEMKDDDAIIIIDDHETSRKILNGDKNKVMGLGDTFSVIRGGDLKSFEHLMAVTDQETTGSTPVGVRGIPKTWSLTACHHPHNCPVGQLVSPAYATSTQTTDETNTSCQVGHSLTTLESDDDEADDDVDDDGSQWYDDGSLVTLSMGEENLILDSQTIYQVSEKIVNSILRNELNLGSNLGIEQMSDTINTTFRAVTEIFTDLVNEGEEDDAGNDADDEEEEGGRGEGGCESSNNKIMSNDHNSLSSSLNLMESSSQIDQNVDSQLLDQLPTCPPSLSSIMDTLV